MSTNQINFTSNDLGKPWLINGVPALLNSYSRESNRITMQFVLPSEGSIEEQFILAPPDIQSKIIALLRLVE